jgi:hypothetical protein
MPYAYIIKLHLAGKVYPIHRDVTHVHPQAVHERLGSHSEGELQQYLDDCRVVDYYGDDGKHLGPDDSGLLLAWAF